MTITPPQIQLVINGNIFENSQEFITGGRLNAVLTAMNDGLATIYASGQLAIAIDAAPVTGGADKEVLYNNAGVLGGYPVSGTGGVVAMTGNPAVSILATGSSTARFLQDMFADVANAKNFGAIGDGNSSRAAANTAAIQAAAATGKTVWLPDGVYYFTTLTITDGAGIRGSSVGGTSLISTSVNSDDIITYTSSTIVPTFSDFTLFAPNTAGLPTKPAGAGIVVTAASDFNQRARFDNVDIAYAPISLWFHNAALWRVTDCSFLQYSVAGLQVENVALPDFGDSSVVGCYFNTSSTTGIGALQYSGGGMKFTANKFLGGLAGYVLALASTSTGVLVFTGNSVENMIDKPMTLTRSAGSGSFVNVVIVGNEFGAQNEGIWTDDSGLIQNLDISGNIINLNSGTGVAINLSNVNHFMIGPNTIKGNGGSPTGISIAADCANGKVSIQNFNDFVNPLVNNSTTVIVEYDKQSGVSETTSTSGWNAFGALFSLTGQTVTFATPFRVVDPNSVVFQAGDTNGAVGGIVTALSGTGMTFIVLSVVTSAATKVTWQVSGIV